MASPTTTFQEVLDSVEQEYGKMNSEMDTELPNRVQESLSEILTEFPYWFLTIQPGLTVPGLFPYDDPPTYSDKAESAWIDVGWFHTTQGVRDYYFSLPADLSDLTSTSALS